MVVFVNKQQVSQSLALSGETLKQYRLDGDWIEGIHWVRINSRCVRYNLDLIQDWLHNRHNPMASPPRRERSSTRNRTIPSKPFKLSEEIVNELLFKAFKHLAL